VCIVELSILLPATLYNSNEGFANHQHGGERRQEMTTHTQRLPLHLRGLIFKKFAYQKFKHNFVNETYIGIKWQK